MPGGGNRPGEPVSPPLRRGSYLLRIQIQGRHSLAVGRLRGGRPVTLDAGSYLYIGSAMGQRGAPLARRLLRHGTRTGSRPHQGVLPRWRDALARLGLLAAEAKPVQAKRLHWHIDYLLDRTWAQLTGAILLVGNRPQEAGLAHRLARDPATAAPVPGFGAGDAPGATHFLRVTEGEGWWRRLVAELAATMTEEGERVLWLE